MSVYAYLSTPNINLLCCICRTPFVQPVSTRTCLHTFCRECIEMALLVARQCPIDRSPLGLNDLTPADPLVRNLVDELEVECSYRAEGCEHACQRQLLSSHLEADCLFEVVPCKEGKCEKHVQRRYSEHSSHSIPELCDKCGKNVTAADREAHSKLCSREKRPCEGCSTEFSSASLTEHKEQCPDVTVPCIHEINGCPWTGPRYRANTHTSMCPYEAIRGFFAVHDRQLTSLRDENATLRSRLDAFEGIVNSLRRELEIAQTALGPWYRPETVGKHTRAPSSATAPPQRAAGSRRLSQELDSPFDTVSQYAALTTMEPPSSSPSGTVHADIASYFPPAEDEHGVIYTSGGHEQRTHGAASQSSAGPSIIPVAAAAPSIQQLQQPLHATWLSPSYYTAYPQIPLTQPQPIPISVPVPSPPHPSPVAPLNLSTTLEGSLNGLRESMVTLSAAVDSLGRKQEVSSMTESMRTAEEIRSLRAVVHGLRMQVHAVMLDHNAQVTGRSGDSSVTTMGMWPIPTDVREPPAWIGMPYGPQPRHPHSTISPGAQPITKL